MQIKLASLLVSVVVASVAFSSPASAADIFPEGQTGYDISFPQCGGPFPKLPYSFGIIGATGGKPFTNNPCLSSQYAWAALSGRQPSLYMNLKSPVGTNAEEGLSGPAGNCGTDDRACQARNFGYKAARDAAAYARLQNATPASWWLDIETMNTWSSDTAMNAVVMDGAVEYLKTQGVPIGIYSSPSQWLQIAGTYKPGLPVWVALAPSASAAPTYCTRGFGGGEVQLVQYISGGYDMNYACRPADRLLGSAGPVGPAGSTAVVASDSDCLNVRAQPGLTATISACLASGTYVTLLEGSVLADGFRWQRVSSGSVSGWVADHYLRSIAPSIVSGTSTATPIPTTTTTTTPIPTAVPAATQPAQPFGTALPPPGGFGLAVWTGLTGTTAEAAAKFLGSTPGHAIYVLDSTSQGFLTHVVGAPDVVNDAFSLSTNQAVIVRTAG